MESTVNAACRTLNGGSCLRHRPGLAVAVSCLSVLALALIGVPALDVPVAESVTFGFAERVLLAIFIILVAMVVAVGCLIAYRAQKQAAEEDIYIAEVREQIELRAKEANAILLDARERLERCEQWLDADHGALTGGGAVALATLRRVILAVDARLERLVHLLQTGTLEAIEEGTKTADSNLVFVNNRIEAVEGHEIPDIHPDKLATHVETLIRRVEQDFAHFQRVA